MASISSPSAQTASLFGEWAPTPCRRGFACPYLRRRCCFFGHSPEEVAAESKVGRDHPVRCRDDAAPAGLGSMERVVEQIVGAPVPQIWEPVVEGVQLAPQERVQNRARELVVDLPVPQIKEDVPVSQTMEKLGDFVQPVIQERILDQISLVLRIM